MLVYMLTTHFTVICSFGKESARHFLEPFPFRWLIKITYSEKLPRVTFMY